MCFPCSGSTGNEISYYNNYNANNHNIYISIRHDINCVPMGIRIAIKEETFHEHDQSEQNIFIFGTAGFRYAGGYGECSIYDTGIRNEQFPLFKRSKYYCIWKIIE